MTRSSLLVRGFLTIGGLLSAADALAQELPDPVFAAQNVLRRPGSTADPLEVEPRPELQALGVRLGNYTLRASTEIAPVYNSNVRVQPDGDSAAGVRVMPTLQLNSNGEHDPVNAYLSGSLAAYASRPTETVGTLGAGVNVTRELSATTTVNARGEVGRFFEDRALSFVPMLSYRPIKYDRLLGSLSATTNTARLIVTPEVDVERLAYHDNLLAADPSQVLVQRTRSFTRIEPSLVVGYAVSDATALYVGTNLNTRRYDLNKGFDSHGYAAYGGIRLRPTALTRLDVALGYQRQFYRQGLTDPKGLYVRVSGLYSPDRQTTVEVTYRREISETGGVEIGGLVRDRVNAAIRRDLLRNFRITAWGELRRYDFTSIDRMDSRVFLGWDARFVVSRQLDLFFRGEQMFSRTSGTASSSFDFDRTTVVSGVALRL